MRLRPTSKGIRKFHGVTLAVIAVLTPFALTIWKNSVPLLVAVSMWSAMSPPLVGLLSSFETEDSGQ